MVCQYYTLSKPVSIPWQPLVSWEKCGKWLWQFGGYMLSYQKAPVAYYKVCIEEFYLIANKCDANQNGDFLPSK